MSAEIILVDDDEDVPKPVVEEKKVGAVSLKDVAGLNVKMLQALCKEKGIKGYSGLKKAQLIDLLTTGACAKDIKSGSAGTAGAISSLYQGLRAKAKKPSKAVAAKKDANARAIVARLRDKGYMQVACLEIHKNDKGHFEYRNTGLVFNQLSRQINAKIHRDGNLHPLSKVDIEYCIANSLPFEIPENMNHGIGSANIKGLEELKESLDETDFHSDEEEEEEEENEDEME